MFADILKETDAVTAKGGEPMKKTWIMYRANLSYDQLNLYLDYLVENKLLGKVGSTEYQTTEKGRNFLKAYSEMNELLKLIVK